MSSKDIQELLLRAVVDGKTKNVEEMINSHGLSSEDNFGYELLCCAIRNKKLTIAEFLLSKNCSVTSKIPGDETILHLAVRNGCTPLIKSLLTKGVPVNHQDASGCTLLYLSLKFFRTPILIDPSKMKVTILSKEDLESSKPVGVKRDHYGKEKCVNKTPSVEIKRSSTPFIGYSVKPTKFYEMLLKFQADVNICDRDGISPLHIGIENSFSNHFEVVELLLAHNADFNKATKDGITPIYTAVQCGNKKICEVLLRYGCDPNISTHEGKTSIHAAIEAANLEIVELLLANNADVNKETNNGITPIYTAAERGNKRICKLLLKFGGDPNICALNGKSPLIVAVEQNHYEAAELLLVNNANVNEKSNDGASPIYVAAMKSDDLMFMLLLNYAADFDIRLAEDSKKILFYAVNKGNLTIIDYIFKHCKIIKENFHDLLRVAVLNRNQNSCNVVKYLVDSGFCLSVEVVNDVELISVIIEKGYTVLFEDMLTKGLDINMVVEVDNYDCCCTLLHIAVKYKQNAIAKLLVFRGALVNSIDFCERTPLFCAVENAFYNDHNSDLQRLRKIIHDLELVESLLKHGANVDTKNAEGVTALHRAVVQKNSAMVDLLLEYSANPDIGDNDGMTSLHLASTKDETKILQLLLDNGSDICLRDKNDNTVFNYIYDELTQNASVGELFQIAEQLLKHLIKLKVGGLLSDRNLLNYCRPLETSDIFSTMQFREDCRAEIIAMKNDTVGFSNMSYYDALKSSLPEFAADLKKANFRTVIQTHGWRKKYPIYQAVIYSKLVTVERKRKLLEQYEVIFSRIIPFLPQICTKKILCYLNSQELRRLICLCNIHPVDRML